MTQCKHTYTGALNTVWYCVNEAGHQDAHRFLFLTSDMREVDAALRERDQTIQKLREALERICNEMGGHDHWRTGGVGGVCYLCERDRRLREFGRTALQERGESDG